jgi:uncharacterized protein YlxW (UPF0749 family)
MAGPREQRTGLVLPAILLVLGVLVTAAIVQERAEEERLPGQAQELVDLVRIRRAAIEDLAAQVRTLGQRLEEAQDQQAAGSARVRAVVTRIDRLRAPAGLAAVEGPGVVIELADSSQVPRTRGELTDLRIQDVDLQLVVNALWEAGAEAVAVNGRRVVATTAIREAGDRVLVNFDPVSSPYLVVAIGDPEALRDGLDGSEIAQQFEVWTQVYGLGFSIRGEDRVAVPALQGSRDLEWAQPVEDGGAA